ncbi:ParB N-terminal domain-containing protein [Streptomyces sp. NPDC127066]|uniref:ParB N-terminal domain-containing protein n=1 Tax=Streptomyces sp. NPDC127066 TaxID=3347125 RepID=UPI00364F7BE7
MEEAEPGSAELSTRPDVPARALSMRPVTVSIDALLPGDTPRLAGIDRSHVEALVAVEAPLPPILVRASDMSVVDGRHRLLAARLRGAETIEVLFFEGSDADAFLYAVEANVAHGLPLSLAERKVAVTRILASHPHMSDRAIARVSGLSAKAVGVVRGGGCGAGGGGCTPPGGGGC